MYLIPPHGTPLPSPDLDIDPPQFSPNSAEGKALQRIESSTPRDWVTVIREGESIDEDAVDEWLTARGY